MFVLQFFPELLDIRPGPVSDKCELLENCCSKLSTGCMFLLPIQPHKMGGKKCPIEW